MRMRWLAGALVGLALTAGCGVHVGVEDDNGKEKASARTTPEPTATPENVIHVQVDPPAPDEPCNGRDGVDIDGVDIPPVESAPVVVPDYTIAGHKVPGFTVPGVSIPAQRVPAQCAVRAPAPAGCFGKVTIPAVTIPAVTIPEVTIPGVDVPGLPPLPPVTQPAQARSAVHRSAVARSKVCAQKVRPGEYRPAVYQPATYRPAVYRRAVYRPAAYRPAYCVKNDCIPAVSIDAISVDAVNVDAVNVDARVLDAKVLPEVTSKCVDVFEGNGRAAYDVCSDVLFDFDKADIRPDAAGVLQQVVRSLNKRYAGRDIQVDGHTDAQGSDAYNDRLSVRRAESVKRWLAGHGIAAGRISTHGYGESEPVATNATDAGRQKNRRVVIGVSKR